MTRVFLWTLAGVLLVFLSGCASTYGTFTEVIRTGIDLSTVRFYIGTTLDFRSLQILDPVEEKGPFKQDGRRYHTVARTDPGKAVAMGADWLSVDFGRGIVITFTRNPASGEYTMPGWGTFTIDGDRYDLMVGVLSGTEVPLLFDPSGTTATDSASGEKDR